MSSVKIENSILEVAYFIRSLFNTGAIFHNLYTIFALPLARNATDNFKTSVPISEFNKNIIYNILKFTKVSFVCGDSEWMQSSHFAIHSDDVRFSYKSLSSKTVLKCNMPTINEICRQNSSILNNKPNVGIDYCSMSSLSMSFTFLLFQLAENKTENLQRNPLSFIKSHVKIDCRCFLTLCI